MVLVNFALECLGTKVTSDKVSSDGYEPRNLLHHGTAVWNRPGFLAECFIKPPVTLTFKLPCPVHLKSIIIDPKVGSQRSSFIMIYSAVLPVDCRPKTSVPASVTQQAGHTSQKRNDVDIPQTEVEPVFKKIGSIQCVEPGQICFYNPRFRADNSATANHSPECYRHRSELRHHQAAMLVAADLIAVRIVGTANSSVAAIGKLEIWGVPARSCPPELNIVQKYISAVSPQSRCSESSGNHQGANSVGGNVKHRESQKRQSEDPCNPVDCTQKRIDNTQNLNHDFSSTLQKAEVNNTVDIPEEFLDALTFEIMATPTVLPSGQCVDMSSLDKFFGEEANYGRQPSDPFTGLPFTANRKPVINTALKVRIDHFLMKHADEPSLRSVPRALGRAEKLPEFTGRCNGHRAAVGNDQSSSGNHASLCGRKERNLKRVAENKLQHHSQAAHPPPLPGDFTDKDSPSVSTLPPSNKRQKTGTGASMDQTETSISVPEIPTSQSPTAPSMDTHEERLRSSLLSSLAAVLGNLPSFTDTSTSSECTQSSADSSPAEEQCSNCGTKLKQRDMMGPSEAVVVYKFPCDHLVCRACLLKAGLGVSAEVICSMCHQQFARSDLIRTHV